MGKLNKPLLDIHYNGILTIYHFLHYLRCVRWRKKFNKLKATIFQRQQI